MTTKQTLAGGADLNETTWADFVQRLQHDCRGDGVRSHCTTDAIFLVQARKVTLGIDPQYTDKKAVIHEDRHWTSPQAYWDDLDDDERTQLDMAAEEDACQKFLELPEWLQWSVLENLDGHTVTGWDESWEYVCSHFTREAADAFILRKAHDYRHGLRVYVDAQLYCWEWNAVKEAIMDGRLAFVDQRGAGS